MAFAEQMCIRDRCATALLSSCHIYKSYDRPEDITTSGLYRDPIAENDTLVSDTTNFGNLPWREVFTDPPLQSLIEAGLKQNTDLLTAAQNVKAAEASLLSARHEDGRQTWTRTNVLVRDYRPQDGVIEMLSINYDITELKEIEIGRAHV